MKRAKTVKKRKFKKRILLYLLFVFIGYQLSYNLIMNFKLVNSNEEFVKCLLVDSNYHMLYEKKSSNLFSMLFSKIIDINKPVGILENTFHFKENKVTPYVENISSVHNVNPSVYIYNSHQAEEYQGKAFAGYNIKPGVMMASYILKEKLQKQNVESLVLEDNLIDYMNLNNMAHSASYKASRYFISDVIKKNNFKLIIDLHRDSVSKEKVTTIINNKSCAKIVFVNGLDYDNSDENLKVSNKLNEMIKEKYPNLTRGILIKGGKGVNGIYNQDLNSNMVLIEIGSNESTIDEVLNTIDLLAHIIGEYVNE